MTSTVVAGAGIGGAPSNQLSRPSVTFIDVNLDLYVADCANGITVAGNGSRNPTVSLRCPTGIVLDTQNYLFIVDSNNHRVVGSGPNGFRCLVGCHRSGSQLAQLSFPSSLSFDRYGNIFVIDQKNNRIQKFQYLENSCGKLKIVE
jgi:hypothetical protein